MKKLSFIIAMAFLMMGVVACDKIDEPYKNENNGGGTIGAGANKHVLLDDYTGVRCVNCPDAGQLAIEIQERYDHKVVVLSVHAGDLATYPPFNLKTPEGDAWWNHFGFQENPSGTVNRKMVNGGYDFKPATWEDAIAEALQETAVVEMTSIIDFDEETRELEVNIFSKFLEEKVDTAYNVVVCVMEDSVVGTQVTHSGIVADFVHRHVFRESINGAWGECLNGSEDQPMVIAPKEMIVKSYTTTLNEAYNADQCYIIAYVANAGTKEVLQVVEKKIK